MTSANRDPIFIIGSYRSGTSVTTWCLGQHPNIWVLPETYWIAEFARDLRKLYQFATHQPAAHFTRCGVTQDDLNEEAAEFIHRMVRRGQERRVRKVLTFLMNGGEENPNMLIQRAPLEPKKRWVDGTPENTHAVDELLDVFPGAKFIHMVRSPHEVVRSLAKFDRAGTAAQPQEAADAYATWRRLAGGAFEAEQRHGSDVVRRFYQSELSDNPEHLLRGMLRFVGERFRPECLDPLAKKINSSKVDEDAVLTADTVPGELRSAFEDNEAFFQQLKTAPLIPAPDPA